MIEAALPAWLGSTQLQIFYVASMVIAIIAILFSNAQRRDPSWNGSRPYTWIAVGFLLLAIFIDFVRDKI